MQYIQKDSREQITFLPDCIEDYISEDNPVRVIDAFVDSLDLTFLGFTHAALCETGRPPYDPSDMLKLYIYGYMNRIRSSRKLMTECRRNIELFFLLGKLSPDFRTISDFRKDNPKALREVFRAFVRLCDKISLYGKELIAIDGTKFRAVNSRDNAYNEEILLKKLQRIEEHISEYLTMLDKQDEDEETIPELSPERIQKVLADLKERKETYQGFLQELSDSGKTQILTTDPEARRMHTKDGFNCCYNVQTAVDSTSHLIAEYEVTNHNTDQGLLCQTADKAKELLVMDVIEVVADKGYDSRKDILDCVSNGIIPNVPFKYDKTERIFTIDYVPSEITEEEKFSKNPEIIRKCIAAGVLPNCYENTCIKLEVQELAQVSCFSKNDDGTVTCPMMNIMTRTRQRGKQSVFRNHDACRQCTNRCTSSKNAKDVCFSENTQYIAVQMYGKTRRKLNPIPDGIPLHPNNHNLDRRTVPKKVSLKLLEDPEKIHLRMCTVEHPFGTVKWYGGAHYVLCKGIRKVTGEIGLSFLAYNLRRAINMIGTKALIEGILAG